MSEKMEKTRLSQKQCISIVFDSQKIPYFFIYNNKIRICIKVLVKKAYQRLQISIVLVSPKSGEMAPF